MKNALIKRKISVTKAKLNDPEAGYFYNYNQNYTIPRTCTVKIIPEIICKLHQSVNATEIEDNVSLAAMLTLHRCSQSEPEIVEILKNKNIYDLFPHT